MTVAKRGSPDQVSDPTFTDAALWFQENRAQTLDLWKRACVELENVAGTGNAITADAGVPLDTLTYAKGNMWSLVPAHDNTGATTIDIDGKGARSIRRADGSNLAAGDLLTGTMYILRDTGTNLRVVSALSTGVFTQTYLTVSYQQTSGTNGGTATTGTRQQYPMNTTVTNTIVGASHNTTTKRFTLPKGTYRIEAVAAFFDCGASGIYLYNVTDAADISGPSRSSGNASSTVHSGDHAFQSGFFTLGASKTLEIQYAVGATKTGSGLGVAVSDPGGAVEEYGQATFTKIS
jgi:hypothetical protein